VASASQQIDRALDKNANRLFAAFALVNLFMARKRLLRATVA
jgi:hypothetical protein